MKRVKKNIAHVFSRHRQGMCSDYSDSDTRIVALPEKVVYQVAGGRHQVGGGGMTRHATALFFLFPPGTLQKTMRVSFMGRSGTLLNGNVH